MKVGEVLNKLMEECGEAIQAAAKCFQHGTDNVWKGEENKYALTREVADILAWAEILGLDEDEILILKKQKLAYIKKELL